MYTYPFLTGCHARIFSPCACDQKMLWDVPRDQLSHHHPMDCHRSARHARPSFTRKVWDFGAQIGQNMRVEMIVHAGSSIQQLFPWSQWCWWCNCKNDALKGLTAVILLKTGMGIMRSYQRHDPCYQVPGCCSIALRWISLEYKELNEILVDDEVVTSKKEGIVVNSWDIFWVVSISMASFPVAQDMIVHPYAYLGVPFQLISGICWNASIFRSLYPIIQWL